MRNFLFVECLTEIINDSVQVGLNSGTEIDLKLTYPLYVKFFCIFKIQDLAGNKILGFHPKGLMCVCVCVCVYVEFLLIYWAVSSVPKCVQTRTRDKVISKTVEARISQNTRLDKKKGSCGVSIEHIFTALEFVPTPTACCAASTKPWTETILDDVPHYPVGQSVSDTGRLGQK